MSNDAIREQLDLVEQQFNGVAAFLASGDAAGLESASAALQALAIDLIGMVNRMGRQASSSPEVVARLRSVSEGMALLRDQMARRSALVQQALAVVVPTAPKPTYSPVSGPFGSAMLHSGAFRVLAA